MIVSFISISGSGKSTHIKMMKEKNKELGFVDLSVKYLYKNEIISYLKYLTPNELDIIQHLTEESNKCKHNGFLCPIELDEIIFDLAIRLYKDGKNVLLDGAPRGLNQAKIFYKKLQDKGIKDYKIINLKFMENEEENSRNRQLVRIMKKNITLEGKYNKISRIKNKIDVYINDTKVGLQYLEKKGLNILKLQTDDDINKNNKIIANYILNKL